MSSVGEQQSRAPESQGARLNLPFLDGVRALAALYVVVYHAYLFTGHSGDAKEDLPIVGWFVGYGFIGVPIFIVLSGFVLMIPVVNQPNYTFKNGVVDFIKRRGKRILPPYFAALAISLALIFLIPVMNQPAGTEWDSKIPVDPMGVIAHLFLVQDLSQAWIYQINGPMWSVAVEWQIYFLMPLILLPLWRRMPAWAVLVVIAVPTVATGVLGKGAYMHAWFLALFAAGMLAAQITVRRPEWSRRAGIVTAVLACLAIAAFIAFPSVLQVQGWAPEMIAGIVTAAALAWLGTTATSGRSNRTIRILSVRPLLSVGLFSYSLYLLHSPILALGNLLLLPLDLPTWAHFLIMILAVVPLSVAASRGFFWLVERHFLNAHQRTAEKTLHHG